MPSNITGSYFTEGNRSYFTPKVQVSTNISNTDSTWRAHTPEEVNRFYNNLGNWDRILPKTDYSYSPTSQWYGLTYNSGIPVTPNLSRVSIREKDVIQTSKNTSFAQIVNENLQSLNETLKNSLSSAISLNTKNELLQHPLQQTEPLGISRDETGFSLISHQKTGPSRVAHREAGTSKMSQQNAGSSRNSGREATSSGENLRLNSEALGTSRRRTRYPHNSEESSVLIRQSPNDTNGRLVRNAHTHKLHQSGRDFVTGSTSYNICSSEQSGKLRRIFNPATSSTVVDEENFLEPYTITDMWNPMLCEDSPSDTSRSSFNRERTNSGWNPQRLAEERYYDMSTYRRRRNVIDSEFSDDERIIENGQREHVAEGFQSRFSFRNIIRMITLTWMATTTSVRRKLLKSEQRDGWIGSIWRFLMYSIGNKMIFIAFMAFLAGIFFGGQVFNLGERVFDFSGLTNVVWNILHYVTFIPWYIGNTIIGLPNVIGSYGVTLFQTFPKMPGNKNDGEYLRIDQKQEHEIDYEKLANAVTDLNLRKIFETDMLLHSSNIKSEIDKQYLKNKEELIEIMNKLKVQYEQLLIKEKTMYGRVDNVEQQIRRLQEHVIVWDGRKMKTYLLKFLVIVLDIHLSKNTDKLKQYLTSSSTSVIDLEEKYSTPAEAMLDTTLLKVRNEIEKMTENDLGEPDRLNEMIENMVKAKIELALRTYDADKTGMADYALESAGGMVLSTRCTDNRLSAVSFSIFGVPLWNLPISPRVVIQPGARPGECWSFQGSTGFLVIQLSERIHIASVSIEHIPKSLAPNGNISSAPKDFTIWGLLEEIDPEPFYLGHFTYDIEGPPIQYFNIESSLHDLSFPMIELKIESNHGNVKYTCLYRFRVHGIPSAS